MLGRKKKAGFTVNGKPHDSRLQPDRPGVISIEGRVKERPINPMGVRTLRPDVFRPGQFGVFDALVHTCETAGIPLQYHFDEALHTHVIDSLDGERHWWYAARYHGGPRLEEPAHRMDTHAYKDWMAISLYHVPEARLRELTAAHGGEVRRLANNGGAVIVPEVTLRTPEQDLRFTNVEVTVHGLRRDILWDGVLTAADIVLSLADQGGLSAELEWGEMVGQVLQQGYTFTHLNDELLEDRTGFTYEVGERRFKGRQPRFGNNLIHMTADVRVILSPEYMHWAWTDLSGGRPAAEG